MYLRWPLVPEIGVPPWLYEAEPQLQNQSEGGVQRPGVHEVADVSSGRWREQHGSGPPQLPQVGGVPGARQREGVTLLDEGTRNANLLSSGISTLLINKTTH